MELQLVHKLTYLELELAAKTDVCIKDRTVISSVL